MQSPGDTGDVPQHGISRDARIVVVISGLCCLLIVALWLLARDAPSARQLESVAMTSAAVSAEQGCTNFARFWTHDSGISVPADAIAGLTNCRQAADGAWFVPSGATDPRLTDAYRLSQTEQQQVAVLSAQLADDLNALDDTLPQSLRDSLAENFEEANLPVFGHTKRGRGDLAPKRARYIRITQAFLIDPKRAVGADYVGWLMERRSAAVDAVETACFADPDTGYLVRACKGIREEFGARFIPLYWDLTDSQLIQEYLVDRTRSGKPFPGTTTNAVASRRE